MARPPISAGSRIGKRLEAATLPVLDGPALEAALALIAVRAEVGPKLLTGAEREALAAILHLDAFHRTRPLTAVRALVFRRVQSGIANRLRRGFGGEDVEVRVRCGEADYALPVQQAEALSTHLRRCLTIALALRAPEGDGSDLVASGEPALRGMRRSGFDAPRATLAAAVAAVDGALATVTFEIDAHRKGLARLGSAVDLADRLERDRAAFSGSFTALYLGAAASSRRGP